MDIVSRRDVQRNLPLTTTNASKQSCYHESTLHDCYRGVHGLGVVVAMVN